MPDDATPPVSAAPVVPPEPDDEPQVVPELLALAQRALAQRVKGSPVVPAATGEPARAIQRGYNCGLDTAHAIVAALEANGYALVPRDLLDRLREMMDTAGTSSLLYKAAAAVVEAVGPTREDTKA